MSAAACGVSRAAFTPRNLDITAPRLCFGIHVPCSRDAAGLPMCGKRVIRLSSRCIPSRGSVSHALPPIWSFRRPDKSFGVGS